ncbi:MAG: hypothetical protein ABI473_06565 [Candidatus Dormibacter sp.]
MRVRVVDFVGVFEAFFVLNRAIRAAALGREAMLDAGVSIRVIE